MGRPRTFLLLFVATLISYAVGTWQPETRGMTGPLTVVLLILAAISLVAIATKSS
ncbi:MAG TPA: hypothetical protein VNG51_01425 [Ktedonobacteraceae bacterium]|nr:hypothetical protein [Ktedonobacteraceae bacterium]